MTKQFLGTAAVLLTSICTAGMAASAAPTITNLGNILDGDQMCDIGRTGRTVIGDHFLGQCHAHLTNDNFGYLIGGGGTGAISPPR
jgi:hypothetical protein